MPTAKSCKEYNVFFENKLYSLQDRYFYGIHCAGSSRLVSTELCDLDEDYGMDYCSVQIIAAGPKQLG